MTHQVTNRQLNDIELDPAICHGSFSECADSENQVETEGPEGGEPSSTLIESSNSDQHLDSDSWRREVTARLQRYRTRRKPKEPRYPSLLLPFDAPECRSRYTVVSTEPVVEDAAQEPVEGTIAANAGSDDSVFVSSDRRLPAGSATPADSKRTETRADLPSEFSAKVIEFPRSAAIPVSYANELAEPVLDFDRPRIVEAPETLPPPPALGGILIEPEQNLAAESEAVASPAALSASIARRALAAALDGLIIVLTLAAMVAVFLRFNPSCIPDSRPDRTTLLLIAGILGSVVALLAGAFEYAFIVYTGSTPGLIAARLRLARFDGSPLNRRIRRWRVLASFLSAFSIGLGYVWGFLDENGLSWHDRITHTHIRNL
jgi:uncharacterized RDD family membrane protein YckC